MNIEQLSAKSTRLIGLLNNATEQLRHLWRSREAVDVSELAIDVLAFRNLDVFEGFLLVAKNHSTATADMMLRPLFEGTVIFEWCALDPVPRTLRFRGASMKSTLELVDLGWRPFAGDDVTNLRGAVEWFERQGYRNLPNVRQMVDEIPALRPMGGYFTYKHLSKMVHGLLESWDDHASRERASAKDLNWHSLPRHYSSVTMACYFAMRNIHLLPTFDSYLLSPFAQEIQDAWTALYMAFPEGEGPRGLPSR